MSMKQASDLATRLSATAGVVLGGTFVVALVLTAHVF